MSTFNEASVAAYVQAQLSAQLEPLQQQVAAQQAQIVQQQAALASYAPLHPQQAASSPAPPGSAPVGSAGYSGSAKPLVKPKPPSTFTALEKAGELDQWEREMRYQFAAYGSALASEQSRIAFAVSYLGPVPLQWWDATPGHAHVATWAEFVQRLSSRFRPVHAAKQARTELFKLKQLSSQSAGAYAAAFQQLLVSLPDMHIDDQVFLFVRGLRPDLKQRVGDKEFATLGAAINAAVQSEGLYGLQADESAASRPNPTVVPMDLNALAARRGPEDDRQEEAYVEGWRAARAAYLEEQLHAMRGTQDRGGAPRDRSDGRYTPRVPGLSPSEVQAYMNAGKCFGCGSTEHRRAMCPQGRN